MKKYLALIFIFFLFFFGSGWAFCYWTFPNSYREIIRQTSEKFQLDPLLVGALVFTESRYQEEAVSSAGAIGLMQLMPQTAQEIALKLGKGALTEKEYIAPETNLELGCFYLAELLERFSDKPLWYVLASYNAGAAKVQKWHDHANQHQDSRKVIQYDETRRFVTQIILIYRILNLYRAIGLV